MIFSSRVAGIPCQIEVTHYTPETPAQSTGTGFADCLAPEPAEFEFKVLDRNGRVAPWLETKITDDDISRIYHEFKNL